MDLRLTEIAENTRAQDQSKQAIQEAPAQPGTEAPASPVSSGFDLVRFAEVTSISGRYVLFVVAIAFLNKKVVNMRALFPKDDYGFGYLVAISSADVYEGTSKFDAVEVEDFPGATVDFLAKLVSLVQVEAAQSKVKTMPSAVAADLGKMRTYFEDNGFELYGSLDIFRRVPLGTEASESRLGGHTPE